MKDTHSGKLDPMLLSSMILYQPIVLIQWSVVLRNARQGQHEDHHQRGTGAGERGADEVRMKPEVDV